MKSGKDAKIDSIDDKPSAIQARLKIAEVRRR